MLKVILIGLSATLWSNELKVSLWLYQESGWGFRKLGKGRVAFDLGKITIKLEFYHWWY